MVLLAVSAVADGCPLVRCYCLPCRSKGQRHWIFGVVGIISLSAPNFSFCFVFRFCFRFGCTFRLRFSVRRRISGNVSNIVRFRCWGSKEFV